MLHLELKRSESEKKEKCEKRKSVETEAEVIRKKINEFESSVDLLTREADEAAEKAERLHNFGLLCKSNLLRNKAKDQETQIIELRKDIAEKSFLMKNMEIRIQGTQ